jgi:hypothetical protein
MIDDNAPIGVIAGFYAIALFTSGMGLGSGLSANGNITKGRNQGIIFCSEKPKECAVEYSYLKLKETQK